tara:strand:+ start:348 stop:629 length:282 start_codon:yes stop_codon:yes gene_type:complete
MAYNLTKLLVQHFSTFQLQRFRALQESEPSIDMRGFSILLLAQVAFSFHLPAALPKLTTAGSNQRLSFPLFSLEASLTQDASPQPGMLVSDLY